MSRFCSPKPQLLLLVPRASPFVGHAEAAETNGGSPVRAGSRVRAPTPETLEISPRFIAANAAAIREGGSSEEGSQPDEQASARPASVLFTFQAETEDELAVAVGDDVQVTDHLPTQLCGSSVVCVRFYSATCTPYALQVLGDEIDGWYNVQLSDGRRGLVPSTYIEIRP